MSRWAAADCGPVCEEYRESDFSILLLEEVRK
jgi:hypothetical protein